MGFYANRFIPYIPTTDYDKIAYDFLEQFYPEALRDPMRVPIEDIASKSIGLDIHYVCLSEETDIFGMTIFTDGVIEIYNPEEMLYEPKMFKAKTILIDPEAVRKTNLGCRNNTIAHECVHWYKHKYYYKAQNFYLPKYAKYCKCSLNQLPHFTEEESIMESQATGIAPRILMPKNTFIEIAEHMGIKNCQDNKDIISDLSNFFCVSKQSAKIRLEECNLI